MGRAVGAAAAGDEAERRAVDEAVEPLDVAAVVERHVVVHGDACGGAASAPCRRSARASRAASTRRRASGGSSSAASRSSALGARSAPCMPTASTRSAWRIAFSDQGVSSGVGDEEHVVVLALERVERPRRLGAVERHAGGQHGRRPSPAASSIGVVAAAGTREVSSTMKLGGSCAAAGTDERDGARARIGRRRACDVGVGEALRQRHGQRAPDDGHFAESRSNSARPSRSTRLSRMAVTVAVRTPPVEKGDLADRLPGADLGERLAPAFEGDGEAPGDDDIERIRRIALAHQDVAALEGARLQLGHEGGALVSAELGEDPHGGKACFGKSECISQPLLTTIAPA